MAQHSLTIDILTWDSTEDEERLKEGYFVSGFTLRTRAVCGRVIRGHYVGSVVVAGSLHELIGWFVTNAKCTAAEGSTTVRNIHWVKPAYGTAGGYSGMTKRTFEKAAAAAGFPNLQSALIA